MSECSRFKTLVFSFIHPHCPFLLEEALTAIGPFCLVSRAGKVKDPMREMEKTNVLDLLI